MANAIEEEAVKFLRMVGDACHNFATVLAVDQMKPIVTPPALPVPNYVKNMVLVNEVWTSIPGWEKDVAGIGFKADVKYGSTVEMSFMRESKYPTDGNIKVFRIYPNGRDNGYPNTYLGQPAAGDFFMFTEDLKAFTHWKMTWPWSNGFARKEEYVIKYPSAFGKNDGQFKITVGGAVVIDVKDWQCEDDGNKGLPNTFFIQDDPSNQVFPLASYTKIWNIKPPKVTG